MQGQGEGAAAAFKPDLAPEDRSAGRAYVRHPAHGVQFNAPATPGDVVGQAYPHMAADLQVGGWVWGVGECR